jgi:hypothetical protein
LCPLNSHRCNMENRCNFAWRIMTIFHFSVRTNLKPVYP